MKDLAAAPGLLGCSCCRGVKLKHTVVPNFKTGAFWDLECLAVHELHNPSGPNMIRSKFGPRARVLTTYVLILALSLTETSRSTERTLPPTRKQHNIIMDLKSSGQTSGRRRRVVAPPPRSQLCAVASRLDAHARGADGRPVTSNHREGERPRASFPAPPRRPSVRLSGNLLGIAGIAGITRMHRHPGSISTIQKSQLISSHSARQEVLSRCQEVGGSKCENVKHKTS